MTDAERPPLLPPHLRDPGDTWVEGPEGDRHCGRFGAAGLLVWHPDHGVLLQHRVSWSHHGSTWGIPGGARKQGESAPDAALREAAEEASVPPHLLTVLHTHLLDLGFWSYTTVISRASEWFEPAIGDAESTALAWVETHRVDALELHPAFGVAWPALRGYLV